MAKQKKHNWFTSLSFGTVALVLTVLLVLGYLSIIVPPEKAWFFTLFGLIYPVVLPATLILFVIALVRRSRTRLVLALALLPSLFFAGRYFQISAPKDASEPALTVVSYNVGLFRHGPEGAWNAFESGHPGVFQDDDGQVYLFYQGKESLNATYYLSVCKVRFE